ncbi:hypothetical protein ACFOEN_06485 [Piscinibacterium candidicorallinum]|jgi:hypothetical protein|uniref:Uncharacterized protein n=1 Tax=Piscinibacterium candidicorallinum TaxID=1793872 RepID=A0ABV7H114_9BURK
MTGRERGGLLKPGTSLKHFPACKAPSSSTPSSLFGCSQLEHAQPALEALCYKSVAHA